MFYSCLNDVFGYCKGKPEFESEPSEEAKQLGLIHGHTCKLDKATCGRYSTTHCSKELGDDKES